MSFPVRFPRICVSSRKFYVISGATVETAGHLTNYFDVTIHLEHDKIDDGLLVPKFAVYRKPQFTAISINNHSLHPTTQKLSIIQSAFTRMLRVSHSLLKTERKKFA